MGAEGQTERGPLSLSLTPSTASLAAFPPVLWPPAYSLQHQRRQAMKGSWKGNQQAGAEQGRAEDGGCSRPEGDITAAVTQAGSELPSSQGRKEGNWMEVRVVPPWHGHLNTPQKWFHESFLLSASPTRTFFRKNETAMSLL